MELPRGRVLRQLCRQGNVEMVRWLEELYGLHTMDAYQLLSQVSLAPIANVVDANYSAVVKAPKAILPAASAYGGIHADLRARARQLT